MKYDWVVEFDIRGMFDNIDHELLMRAVRKHTYNRWVILHNERWLTAPFQTAEGEVVTRDKRTPQGGVVVGWLKLVTAWPFAEDLIRDLAKRVKAFVVPEINYGQIALEVERCAAGKAQTILVPHAGGDVHEPHVILEAIRNAARQGDKVTR